MATPESIVREPRDSPCRTRLGCEAASGAHGRVVACLARGVLRVIRDVLPSNDFFSGCEIFLRFSVLAKCFFMVQVVSIVAKGSMVLREAIRRRLGLLSECERVELSEVEFGVMMRRFGEIEGEVYTDERMAEFEEHNEKALKSFKGKIKNALHYGFFLMQTS